MKTNILGKRFLTFIAFLLAIVSAVLLCSVVPKQTAKADEEPQTGIVCTFHISSANTEFNFVNTQNAEPTIVGLTSCDWGDGTVDNLLYHTYTEIGTYTARFSGVTDIGDYSFYECYYLTSIVIFDSVIRLGNGCFCNCTDLATVTFQAMNLPTCGGDPILIFYHCPLTAIYVPAESIDDYVGGYFGENFGSLILPLPTQSDNNEMPASNVNATKITTNVKSNNMSLVLISTVVLLVSAIAIVAVIKRFKSRRY